MPNADRHAVWDTREVPTFTTLYHWTSNSSLWWEFLQTDLLRYIEHMHLAVGGWIYLRLGGVPWHFVRNIMEYMNECYWERWMGRDSPMVWLAQWSNLELLNFFLCVVPQQLVHCAVETDWSTLFMSGAWQHACSHKVLMLKVWLGCKRLNLSYWMLIENCVLYWLLQ
jgi:hypothetical protein